MPAALRGWLTDPHSLTSRIRARCAEFAVRPLRQCAAAAERDEWNVLGVPDARRVRVREVLLCADGRPVVFAHSVVRLRDVCGCWRLFAGIGSRPLGEALFADARVARSALSVRRIDARHPLFARVRAAGVDVDAPLWARRSLFIRDGRPLLVTEVFLPAISELAP
ncbi:chorismate lyase [Methyloversatilis sp.]|uniref:chorismate--pyruvate lyase family protein n=1 Tax=Methyloversatilis sp. TaxID=2569862 RepID=UPI0035B2CBBF